MASEQGSITRCIALLKAGDHSAVPQRWEAYSRQLVALARKRLRDMSFRTDDEADVVLTTFKRFFRLTERGQFLGLADRDDRWQLLIVITVRKATNLARHERRPSREGGRVTALEEMGEEGFEALDPEPTPPFAALMAEECQRRLDSRGETTLRRVANWRLDQDTDVEIGAKFGCIERTVERKFRAVRRHWAEEPAP
jgi:DNA-directed RNA polymerase specialized sigma24 family protein